VVVSEQQRSVRRTGERAAGQSLRQQLARLERELAQIVVEGYPYLPVRAGVSTAGQSPAARVDGRAAVEVPAGQATAAQANGPRLLTLGELERQRDELVQRVRAARAVTARRAECERRARARFQGMRLEPGRYKFARLRVADLGEGGCGVWQVRPRLGLIGMLAGWWELKLSSGCP
jgi:hypothetical protein